MPSKKCSICFQTGHIKTNQKFHPKIINENKNEYSEEILKSQFSIFKDYYKERKKLKDIGIKFRNIGMPEDISENIIKFIVKNKLEDDTCKWEIKTGDLFSDKYFKIECKSFTSNGPISFTPKSDWNCIFFLDARKWENDHFKVYKCSLTRLSEEWKNIKVNKNETFNQQSSAGRRPRLNWKDLYSQIKKFTEIIYEGTFDDIFNKNEL